MGVRERAGTWERRDRSSSELLEGRCSVACSLSKSRAGRDHSSLPIPSCSSVVFQEQLAEGLLDCWEKHKVAIKYLRIWTETVLRVCSGVEASVEALGCVMVLLLGRASRKLYICKVRMWNRNLTVLSAEERVCENASWKCALRGSEFPNCWAVGLLLAFFFL